MYYSLLEHLWQGGLGHCSNGCEERGMKQIIEYFGSTIVAILAAVCVLGLFSGMTKSLREIADTSLDFSQPKLAENQAFFNYQTSLDEEVIE